MEQVIYTKYSNDRGPAFAIRTSMVQKEDGSRVLYKEAEYSNGEAHIRHIEEAARALEKSWKDTEFQVNQCTMEGKRIRLEFLKAHTLEEELDMLLEKGETEAVVRKVLEILEIMRKMADCRFEMSPEFQQVFGKQEIPEGEEAVNPADIDMIFTNMFLEEDGNIHVIDYEWTFFFPVPVDFIRYRALYYYLVSASKRQNIKDQQEFYLQAGITQQQQETYRKMEENFQTYLREGCASVGMLYQMMGKPSVSLYSMITDEQKHRMQIYLNDGKGFCEEHSYFIEQKDKEMVEESIPIPAGTRELWIDPVISDCMLSEVQLSWEGGETVSYDTNGYEWEPGCILFHHNDPKLMIAQIPEGKNSLKVSYHISILEHGMAEKLMDKINKTGRIKNKIRSFIKE